MHANRHAPYLSKGRAALSCSPLPIRCLLVPLALSRSRAVIWAQTRQVLRLRMLAVKNSMKCGFRASRQAVERAHVLKGRGHRKLAIGSAASPAHGSVPHTGGYIMGESAGSVLFG